MAPGPELGSADAAYSPQDFLMLLRKHGQTRFEAPAVRHFLRSRDGATAVEYALIVGILVIAILAGAVELGRVAGQSYGNIAEDLAEIGR